eukprot:4867334-Prymnesium_polylepis.1
MDDQPTWTLSPPTPLRRDRFHLLRFQHIPAHALPASSIASASTRHRPLSGRVSLMAARLVHAILPRRRHVFLMRLARSPGGRPEAHAEHAAEDAKPLLLLLRRRLARLPAGRAVCPLRLEPRLVPRQPHRQAALA